MELKAQFISPVIEEIKYLRGEMVKNYAINITLCKHLEKSNYAWYPDNNGLPSIKFIGCDAEWVFKNETDRDAEYFSIASNLKDITS